MRLEDGMVVARAGAGAMLPQLVAQAASLGAVGIDALAGIPATVGGALRMNAGTDREIGEFVREVCVQIAGRPAAGAGLGRVLYRSTTLARDAIVADVTLAFECGDPAAVRARTQDRLVRRKATQPVAVPNAGSCFRNPPGDKAGRLIEAAGAKGWRAGGAEVSTLHANFIVNVGRREGARCQLAARARSPRGRRRVRRRSAPRSSPRRRVRSGCLTYGSRS